MFSEQVDGHFKFLESEFGFAKNAIDARTVTYQKAQVCISLSHTELDEISMTVGLAGGGADSGFSSNLIVEVADPTAKTRRYNRLAHTDEQIANALSEEADTLKKYGERVLKADASVVAEMRALVRKHVEDRTGDQIRARAQEAFGNKNYEEALRHYQMLGGARNKLDAKRMEICERHVG